MPSHWPSVHESPHSGSLDGYYHIIVDQMLQTIANDGYKMQTLISEIVTSYPFLNRRVVE